VAGVATVAGVVMVNFSNFFELQNQMVCNWLVKLGILFFCGFSMFAQNHIPPSAQGQAAAYEGMIATYGSLRIKELCLDGKRVYLGDQEIERDELFRTYFFKSKTYKVLSQHECRQFDAMDKIKVKRGKLYYDGREIKTNAKVIRVTHAWHWKGGILVAADTSLPSFFSFVIPAQVGFIDLQTNSCDFVIFRFGFRISPVFIVPVKINESNKDLQLSVKIPKKISLDERFECAISLKNVSNKTLLVPENLWDGLGIRDRLHKKVPEMAKKAENRHMPLKPSETHTTTVTLEPRSLFLRFSFEQWPYKSDVSFFWDGFLNPDDPSEMSRFVSEETVVEVTNVPPFAIDTANSDLLFDVKMPKKFSMHGGEDYIFIVRLTNISGKSIMIPDSLLHGLRITLISPKQRVLRYHEYPNVLVEPQSKLTPLMPSETRETVLSMPPTTFFGYHQPNLLEFTLDLFLDPGDRSKLTRFTVEKRAKVVP
jgi:hypothetical protein